jgi:RNA polymerase sigma-70 factor, ECF subfamily
MTTTDAVTFNASDRTFVFSVVRRLVRNEQDANDIAQETLLLAYRYRDSFRGESRYRTWLYRIASTTALSFLRSAKRRAIRAVSAHPDDVFASVCGQGAQEPGQALASKQQVNELMQHVASLSPAYRDVVELRCEELSEIEVARRLGLTTSTVKIRAHRARKILREQLSAA